MRNRKGKIVEVSMWWVDRMVLCQVLKIIIMRRLRFLIIRILKWKSLGKML